MKYYLERYRIGVIARGKGNMKLSIKVLIILCFGLMLSLQAMESSEEEPTIPIRDAASSEGEEEEKEESVSSEGEEESTITPAEVAAAQLTEAIQKKINEITQDIETLSRQSPQFAKALKQIREELGKLLKNAKNPEELQAAAQRIESMLPAELKQTKLRGALTSLSSFALTLGTALIMADAQKRIIQTGPMQKAINTFTTYVGAPVANSWNKVVSSLGSYLPSWSGIKSTSIVKKLKNADKKTVWFGTALAGSLLLAAGVGGYYAWQKRGAAELPPEPQPSSQSDLSRTQRVWKTLQGWKNKIW